jgi:hypothetical protein
VADAAFAADPELGQAAVGAFGAGRVASVDEDSLRIGELQVNAVGEEPTVAISRGLSPSRRSSAAVVGNRSGSLGEPGWVAAGMIRPRAPRRVFSQTSVSWKT